MGLLALNGIFELMQKFNLWVLLLFDIIYFLVFSKST